MTFADPATLPQRSAENLSLARNGAHPMTPDPTNRELDANIARLIGGSPGGDLALGEAEYEGRDLHRAAEAGLRKSLEESMPINLAAHEIARDHRGAPYQTALELSEWLAAAAFARGDAEEYDSALIDLATSPGGMGDALNELDGADLETIAQTVVDLLRAKAERA